MAPRHTYSPAHAARHLRAADPVIGALLDRYGPLPPRADSDAYAELLRAVLYQQLAGAAARTIERRWRALYGAEDAVPTPEQILDTPDEAFRGAGVSRQKAGYLRDIAAAALDGRVDFPALESLPDDEVVERLTAIRGVGTWTAQMLLLFHLDRRDVLPTGDYGLRRGMQLAYGLPEPPQPAEMQQIAAPWSPYRSIASRYLWLLVSAPASGRRSAT